MSQTSSPPQRPAGIHRFDGVHAEGQHISVTDGIHDGVGMKLVAEGLRCCAKVGVLLTPALTAKMGVPVKPTNDTV